MTRTAFGPIKTAMVQLARDGTHHFQPVRPE